MKDEKLDGNSTCLIVERIWATGYSSFAIIKPLFGSVAGTKISSTEVLIEQIHLGLVIHNAMVGHSIFWEYTNGPNLTADPQRCYCYQKHHHTEIHESPAAAKPHGQRD
ncbi:hypothetical protein SESBI_04244 [Sesbania bispinosa]|nr:hypothetical protein SESBI_04244 [Sesbania bispinosa]